MNMNNIIKKLEINVDCVKTSLLNCDYLKSMVFIINSCIVYNELIKENLDVVEINILNSKSHRGQWKLFTELNNYEMKRFFTILSKLGIGSFILFVPNEFTFKSFIFIKDNNVYEWRRINGEYKLYILSYSISLINLLSLDLIDLESYRDIIIENIILK